MNTPQPTRPPQPMMSPQDQPPTAAPQDDLDALAQSLGIDWSQVDKEQFSMGMRTEEEHADITGGDPMITAKIALAHLKEIPDYYTRLKEMEEDAKGEEGEEEVEKVEVKKPSPKPKLSIFK